ncbi:ComEC/Rec2 family competence protein [Nakamurella endophytica]|uniref:Competence protein ComEC n=1 Tax=Nakamurella endophytica TaxID=1748367 RepID=A0A917SKC5_9ACTN|nr:ComEC/Rec2 family competence protein [Nakamurella endophytica]GGL84727.1 competence protein ComEC [Nakamurella endophytica]
MTGRRARRAARRRELEEPPARLDLRLALPATAAWAGALLGSTDDRSLQVASVLAVSLSCLLLCRTARGRLRHGAIAATALFLGLELVAGVEVRAAAADPLIAAAADGSWAQTTLTVAAVPTAVAARPVGADGGDGGGDGAAGGDGLAGGDGAAGGEGARGGAASRWRFAARDVDARVAGRAWSAVAAVTVFGDGDHWRDLAPGTRVRVSGLLAPDTFGTQPSVLLRARDPPVVLTAPPWWQRAAQQVRRRLAAAAAPLDPDARGLLLGVAVGDTSAIPDGLAADARTTGLTHLVAVSGSHFAVLCGAVVLVLRRIGRRSAVAGGAVTVAALVVLVGPQPSVLRAAAMGGLSLVGVLLGRPRAAVPALSAAVVVLLVLDPSLATAPGFVLSVQATAALALLAPVWSRALRRRGWPAGAADALAVPLAATVATVPVIASLSGSVSLVGVPANILVAPVVAVSLVLGVLCAAVGAVWPAGGAALARADAVPLQWIGTVAHTLARWPSATLPWPASVGGVLVLAGLLAVVVLALSGRRSRAVLLAAAVGAAVVFVPARALGPVPWGWPPPDWLLVGCEVGQGDAMVLSTGEPGVGVVVDAGPDPALADACLDRLAVATVPLVVLTHLHADHVDGLPGIWPGRSVGAIGVGPDRSSASAWSTLTGAAAARGAPVLDLRPGVRWSSGALTLEVLGPAAAFHGTDSDPNNDSVVLRATLRGVRILMTGDIEREAQQALLDRRTDLRADVLEQPHHGSARFLPAFAAAVSARVSVIGVGSGNSYGQPSPSALATLAAAGTAVLRTDLQGDVAVTLSEGVLATAARGAGSPVARGAVRGRGS